MSLLDPRLREVPPQTSSTQNISNAANAVPIAANPSASRSPAAPQHQHYPSIQDGSQYLPQTPHSAGHATSDNDGRDGGHEDSQNDPKRPRACEACRGLKVRCEPDPTNPDGPCKRCGKAGRNCVVTVPSRKRQKKTDSRVAELEKKIEALTAQVTKSGATGAAPMNTSEQDGMNGPARHNPYQQVTNGAYSSPFGGSRPEVRMNSNEWTGYPKAPEFESKKSSAPPMVVAGQKRKHNESHDYPSSSGTVMTLGEPSRRSMDAGAGQQQYSFSDSGRISAPKQAQTHEYADVVDRGLLTAEMANKMFTCYVERMAPHLPAVIFPPGTTSAEVRKSKPTLFLAILGASSGMNYPELQRTLTKEVMGIYAERVIVNGEKTLELIQALHVSTLWYWPPEHFEELKFYQLIHIAAVMAIDIGMGKKSKSQKGKYAGLWRDHPWRRTPYPDPECAEARRSWLVCYFLCCNASMGLRRPNLIRWTPFMADCIEFLEASPEAAPSDRVLCQWVRSQHIAEEIGTQFSMDDPMATVSIADSKVQYALKGFERDLEKWSSQITPDIQSHDLKLTEHVVNLYMHEVAMHVDHNVDEFKPPFTEEALRGMAEREPDVLTSAHISALSTCLTSIDGIFENFFKFDIDTIRCLPIYNFIRLAYAVVVLIKMYFAAATPNSELGKVINKDNMKVEQYLDNLLDIFRASAAEEKSRPSAKFLMVLMMLKTWFHRQREGKAPPVADSNSSNTLLTEAVANSSNDGNQNANHRNLKQENNQQTFSPANTPLQLLSEVATGNSRGQPRPDSAVQYQGSNEWQQQPQQQYGYDAVNQMAMQQGYSNIDPALGMDFGSTMGDGFEQAFGMTLGVGDFGAYFGEEAFYGLMDTAGNGFDGL
ncbi:hypothetical protein BGZ60DRAFT_531622 [Tricladium varicosporioides]|nr:hypothetical protein BGZ60DRAFT_531622 [Hymenoscyphus varicosporioides]